MKPTEPTTRIAATLLGTLLTLAACDRRGGNESSSGADSTPSPDNTATNEVDRSGTTKTPMDQSQSSRGVDLTAQIRRAIVEDSSMSLNAQNCKIITDSGGFVTLRGVVDSQAERDAIEEKAKAVAGVTGVDNQLEVKPD
jgi:osmotically-inducible protein OsmY